MARKSSSSGIPTQRQLRAGELVRHALSDVLAREDFRDPALADVIITVGEVRCSPDLRHANIFVTPLGDDTEEGRKQLAEALMGAPCETHACITAHSTPWFPGRQPTVPLSGAGHAGSQAVPPRHAVGAGQSQLARGQSSFYVAE